MSVNEKLMRVSSGSVSFRSDIPVSVTTKIRKLVDERASGVGAHVVITRVPVDPSQIGDTAVLAAAKYTGRITKRPSRTSLEFDGLESWLDTYLDADTSRVAGTPSQWLGDLLANDLTAGTVNASGTSNVTRSFPAHITTRREALDVVAGLGGWEWRVQPDFTIDAATKTNLFQSPPQVVVTRKSEGPDGTYRGVRGGMLDQSIDVSNLATKAVALAQGEGTAIAKGTATTSRSLRAPKGSAASFVTVFSAPSEESANANTAAQNFLNLQGARFDISVNSTTHDIPSFVRPGDEVYLYDLAAGIVDTSNQIPFRGETIFPAKVRCLELTWPIEEGCGVYIRSNAASPTWIDVTPWVEWESGDSWWKVGDWSPPSYGRANRSNPEVEDRIGSGSGDVAIGGDLTVGDDLTVTGDIISSPPRLRLRRSNNQSASSGIPTTISWDTEDADVGFGFTPHATTATTITIPSTGIWAVTVTGGWSAGLIAAGRNFVDIRVSSALTGMSSRIYRGGASTEDNITTNATVPLNANDTIQVVVFQGSGSSQNWTGWLHLVRVAAL